MYGRLVDGVLIEAPATYVTEEGIKISDFNKSINLMIQYGFKPVIDNKPGYDVETQYCKHIGYIDTGRYIRYTYEVEEIEPTYEEKVIQQTNLVLQMLEVNINDMITNLSDKQASQVPLMFPSWKVGEKYAVGNRVEFEGKLYKALQPHTSQLDWRPCDAPSLFAKALVSEGGQVLDWEQPDSTNPYMAEDKVKYDGKIYVSLIDNNVWSPVDYPAGWKEVIERSDNNEA